MESIKTTLKPFYFRWSTSQDGHLLNYFRQDIIVIGQSPYIFTTIVGLHSEEDLTSSFPRHHPIESLSQTLAILMALIAGMAAPSAEHSWLELTGSTQAK